MTQSNSLFSKLILLLALLFFTTQTMAIEDPYNVSQGRIKAEDSTEMTKVAMAGLEQHKKENNGQIDLAKFKPVIMQELYSYLEFEHIDRRELLKIKAEYERLEAQSSNLSQVQIEKKLIKLFENMMKYVNDSSLQCVKQGATCNNWGCCNGLTCATVPERARQNMGQCKRFDNECKANTDCCSGICGEGVNGKKVCAVVRRCFKPQRANASCDKNPTCEVGNCELYNAGTTAMGECVQNKNACSGDDQCCSGKCDNKRCVPHYVCKNCVGHGKKPRRAEKCCEGLYKGPNGKCIPTLPPFVNKEQEMKKDFSMLGLLVSLVFGDVAYAQPGIPGLNQAIIRHTENNKIKNKIINDVNLQKEEQMKGYTGMSSNARNGVDIKSLDDFKDHELETFSTKAGTDFNSCHIDLKADYLINLKLNTEQNMLGIEMAVLAFEHMILGDGTIDYWAETTGGSASTNIHARAAAVAQKHADKRVEIFDELDEWQIKMECLCWDSKGYPNLSPEVQRKFAGAGWPLPDGTKAFERASTPGADAPGADAQCPDEMSSYIAYRKANPNTDDDDDDYAGDASGIKGKYLVTKWTNLNRQFYTRMFISNSTTFQEIYTLAGWLESNNWGENTTESIQINKFTTREWRSNPNIAAAVTMALLAAGVVAISGGFATATMASLWLSVGIIAGAGSIGAGGMWLIGAMKGAWESRSPYLQDEFINTWKCGKKSYCSDFKRALILPKAKACGNKYVSGNGCIKNFLAYTMDGEDRFLVDPWVPVGVDKGVLLKDQTPLATRMSTAATRAIGRLKNLHQNHWRSNYLSTSYLKQPLLDSLETGYFSPLLKRPYSGNYKLSEAMITTIKDSAKEYAMSQQYLFPNMQEDLNKFADYSFDYHFVWPRLSQSGMIAYPMPGMISYFMLMAEAMNEKQGENFDNVEGYNQLHAQHLQDLIRTINGFNNSNNLEGVEIPGLGGITSRLDEFEKDLAETIAFNGLNLGAGEGIDSSRANLTEGGLSGSASSNSLGSGSIDPNSTLGKAALAFGKNRAILDKQKEKLAVFTKAVGPKKAKELTDQKNALTKSFFSPLGASSGLNLGSSGGAPGSGGSGKVKSKSKEKDWGKSSLSTNIKAPNYNLNYDTGSNNNSNSNGYSTSGEDAQNKIKEAIEFRNQNPSKFEKQDGDTLFKIITRSYIRSYDKLLKKRKKRIIDEDY
jgi:hypothetical protein